MNIRFDSKACRIRVTQEEAELLLRRGQWAAETRSFTGPIEYELRCGDESASAFQVTCEGPSQFIIMVPRADLRAHVEGGPEITSSFTTSRGATEIHFEIDRFTKKRRPTYG